MTTKTPLELQCDAINAPERARRQQEDTNVARIAVLEAALRSIIKQAGPQYGRDNDGGTINGMSFTARQALGDTQ